MSAIPLHIQRRFEQRWAARLIPPVKTISPESVLLKRAAPTSRRTPAEEKPAGLNHRASGFLRPGLWIPR